MFKGGNMNFKWSEQPNNWEAHNQTKTPENTNEAHRVLYVELSMTQVWKLCQVPGKKKNDTDPGEAQWKGVRHVCCLQKRVGQR